MHVLLLGPYPPPHGGVQTNLVAIRKRLLASGAEVSVINLTRYRQAAHDGVYYPESGAEAIRLLRRIPADIRHLHVGGELPLRVLLLALACAWIPGPEGRPKSVFTFHSGGYPSSAGGKTASRWTLRGFVLRRFDRLIAINRELEALYGKFGAAADRVRFILPHAPVERTAGMKLAPALEEFYARHEQVLLSMGWLAPEYDYPLQIRALARLRRKYRGAGLAIFGAALEGTGAGASLEAELRRLAAASGEAEHILLAGDVPHAMALEAMARCAIFLRTTLYDGDSIAVREALELGSPVIATDNGMRPEGVTLVPIGGEDAVVEAAARMLAESRGEGARQKVVEDDPIAAVVRLYGELEGERTGTRP